MKSAESRSIFLHPTSNAPCRAERRRSIRASGIISAPAALPLLARYDLDTARGWSRDTPRRPRRRHVALPRADAAVRRRRAGHARRGLHAAVSRAARSARRSASIALYIKDESLNPTNSFKARGQSAAITRAKYLGATTIALPTAGNAGNAAAAYAAAAGLACEVFIPKDAKRPFVDECRLYGANVTLVDGLITDAGRMAAEHGGPLGWYDVSTLKEPYRIEGKKTMAYELAEQMDWKWPDWIVYPTGGGTGMVGMWKAFEEIERSAGCRPAGGRGWCRCRPRAARRSCARSNRAPRRRSRGKTRRRSPTACACRGRSATS